MIKKKKKKKKKKKNFYQLFKYFDIITYPAYCEILEVSISGILLTIYFSALLIFFVKKKKKKK